MPFLSSRCRHVVNILPETDPTAESLLVVEVITPSGHWSSYPPHKHDQDAMPEESFLEETYYHRLNPAQGRILSKERGSPCGDSLKNLSRRQTSLDHESHLFNQEEWKRITTILFHLFYVPQMLVHDGISELQPETDF